MITPNQLKNQIIKNQFPNLLLFTGPETYVKNFYINKISSNWKKISNVKNINFNAKSLFPTNYLIEGSSLEDLKDNELINIKDKALLALQNKYIFVFYSNEKISKNIENVFSNFIVNFNPLTETHLINHFSYSELSYEELKEIFGYCNYDFLKIKSEIDKIKAYTIEKNITPSIAFQLLKAEGVIIQPIGDIIFNFTNAILAGNITQTNYWLYKIKQTSEPFLEIVSALYNSFKNLYLVKATEKNKNARAKIGIEQNRIWGISKNIKIYNEKELERNLMILQTVEEKIKFGLLSEDYALDYLVLNLLG